MGADVIGWRNCPLQQELQPEGFLRKLKLRALKAAVDEHEPPEKRASQKITFSVTDRGTREYGYTDLVAELGSFEQGIPECASCPISGGRPLGCYKYVSYPVDESFERLVFDFFVAQVATKGSIAQQIHHDMLSRVPSAGTGWHLRRGTAAQGALASLPKPLQHSWGGFFSKKHLDSAQILASLFVTLDDLALVVGYTNFWLQLDRHARERSWPASATLEEARDVLRLQVALLPLALQGQAVVLVDG